MSWGVTIPPTDRARFAEVTDAYVRVAASAAASHEARQAIAVAATALKRLIAAWPVATPERSFAATLRGHANSGGDAPTGSVNDRITIDLWRAG